MKKEITKLLPQKMTRPLKHAPITETKLTYTLIVLSVREQRTRNENNLLTRVYTKNTYYIFLPD